ncbi:hypothetical protein V1511DRAFT_461221 [Dipodascopsis uninucleata]
MFRTTTPSAVEELINKATDENLTSENWEYIIAVCDKVNDLPDSGPRDAVAALQKRLTHRAANVQLYSLALTESLAQNCGTKMHRELASRAFTQTLIRVASDRSVHASVKIKLIQTMELLVSLFKNDPSLSIMEESLDNVKSMNPRLHAPDKPMKPELQRQETSEDEELKMVLALSLQESKQKEEKEEEAKKKEEEQKKNTTTQPESSKANVSSSPNPTATISRVRALYDLNSTEPGELSFRRGDIIYVLESVYHEWWKGSLHGEVGIFPLNYVTPVPDPTPEDLQREAEEESQVFNETRSVERLLALLSSPEAMQGSADSDEIQNLYRSAVSIRPKLIKLIDRYSQRKDELIELNERFSSAMQKYDAMMESYVNQYRSPRMPYMNGNGSGINVPITPSIPSMPPINGSSQTPVPQQNQTSFGQQLPSYASNAHSQHTHSQNQPQSPLGHQPYPSVPSVQSPTPVAPYMANPGIPGYQTVNQPSVSANFGFSSAPSQPPQQSLSSAPPYPDLNNIFGAPPSHPPPSNLPPNSSGVSSQPGYSSRPPYTTY